MKRITLTILAALIAVQISHAGWWRTFGEEGYDVGNCVQITSDGNYIIAGKKDGYLWLLKVDTLGEPIWSKTYGRSEGHQTRWTEPTNDEGYVIAAWTPSLVKVNDEGDTLWTRDYGMKSYCVQVASDGGYIVLGGDNGYEADEHLLLVKTNSQGDTVWTKTYGVPSRNRNSGFFIQVTSDSGYIITGATGEESEEFATKYLWLVKIDANGDTLWTREYGTGEIGESNKGYCVRQTLDGGYIITGYKAYEGIWLLKTDANGDTLWTKVYATAAGGTGFNVQQTADGGYIVTGTTETFTASLNPTMCDLWLLKTDSLGDTLWTRKYPGGGSEAVGTCVQQTSDNGFIATGVLNGDLYLLKTDSLGLLAIEEFPITPSLSDWEIIASIGSEITLHYKDRAQGFHASIFNVSGQKVDEIYSSSTTGSIKWGADQPNGVYFIQVNETKLARAERVVLIH